MGKCVVCGRSGLFVKVNSDGICFSCFRSPKLLNSPKDNMSVNEYIERYIYYLECKLRGIAPQEMLENEVPVYLCALLDAGANLYLTRTDKRREVKQGTNAVLDKHYPTVSGRERASKQMGLYWYKTRNPEESIRAEWLLASDDMLKGLSDPINRCSIIFGDILYNPSCIHNYDRAPLFVGSIFELDKFRALFSEAISTVLENYFDILNK